jgi:hypothetical protein
MGKTSMTFSPGRFVIAGGESDQLWLVPDPEFFADAAGMHGNGFGTQVEFFCYFHLGPALTH